MSTNPDSLEPTQEEIEIARKQLTSDHYAGWSDAELVRAWKASIREDIEHAAQTHWKFPNLRR